MSPSTKPDNERAVKRTNSGPIEQRASQEMERAARKKPSVSTALVQLAHEYYTYGVSTLGDAFALPRRGPRIVSMLRGGRSSLRALLAREYFRRHGGAAPQQALADALLVVEGIAQESQPVELHQRVARHDDVLYLDLGDQTGQAVAIYPGHWSIEDRPPMLFRRTALTAALPVPIRGSALDDLWRALNAADADRPLVLAWLISALIADIPHPALSLQGEHGTAKTTALRTLVSLIDPSPAPARKPPRDAEGWVTAAAGSWIVGIDNLSSVPDWLSDSICRAVTGDGDVRRKLYTDGEHAVFCFRRVVALTSIDLGALRGDLADRVLPITLQPIDESRRMRDAEIHAAWASAHPGVLGSVLDLAAEVLQRLPNIQLPTMPRMADYAQVLAAVDQVMGTRGMPDYLARQGEMARDTLASDPLIVAIAHAGGIEGTAAEIYARLTPERPPRDWPAHSRAVTQRLRRHSPAMRRTGWTIAHDDARNLANVLRWSVRPPTRTEMASDPSSSSSSSSSPTRDTRDTRVAYGPSTYDDARCPACDGEGCPWCQP
jgi:hypothetical protein